MRRYYFQFQFGHTGDAGKTRIMSIFITKNDDLIKNYQYREFLNTFFEKLLKRLENKNIKIKKHPSYNSGISPRALSIIINWDDILFYKKIMMYKYNFRDSMSSLCNKDDIDENEIFKIADEFIFLDDSNREQEYKKLCDILITKKDITYNFPWEGESMTNLEFCIKYGSKELLKKYNHYIQGKNFDLI